MDLGVSPPSGPLFKTMNKGATISVARDANSNALGGIRTIQSDLPVARADGFDCDGFVPSEDAAQTVVDARSSVYGLWLGCGKWSLKAICRLQAARHVGKAFNWRFCPFNDA